MENQFGFPENGNGKLEKPNFNFRSLQAIAQKEAGRFQKIETQKQTETIVNYFQFV